MLEKLGFTLVRWLSECVIHILHITGRWNEMLDERLPRHSEPLNELQMRGILIDGITANGDKRLLLQIFSETLLGLGFFEFIQRSVMKDLVKDTSRRYSNRLNAISCIAAFCKSKRMEPDIVVAM